MKKHQRLLGIIAVLVLVATGALAQTPTPAPQPVGGGSNTTSAVYINEIDFAKGTDLTANVGTSGITIPVAVRLSTGQQVFDLRGLPIMYQVSSPTLKQGDYQLSMEAVGSLLRVFSKVAGPVILTLKAPTTALGSPSVMYAQVVINFFDTPSVFQDTPMLVVASTQKATTGQTANLTVVIPPGNYPAGDYHLGVIDDKGNQLYEVPLGQVINPGQAVPLVGHQVLPFDRGGWLYGTYQLSDYKRPGLSVGYGSGYANMKYAGIRNLDASIDDMGNINMDVNTGNVADYYRAFLVTTDGFAVELPVPSPMPKANSGVRLTYYKGSMANAPLFTAGEYTPVVVEYIGGIGGGSVLVHSLPNAIHLDGDSIPFPN